MIPPVSRRRFLGASAGSTVALASGPLLAQADAPPSKTVIVGIMGLNRGMEVAAALETQKTDAIRNRLYCASLDPMRRDQHENHRN